MPSEITKSIAGLFTRPHGATQTIFLICCGVIISSIGLPLLSRWISRLIQILRAYRVERDQGQRIVDDQTKPTGKDPADSKDGSITPGNRQSWWFAFYQLLFLWQHRRSPKPLPPPESAPLAELECLSSSQSSSPVESSSISHVQSSSPTESPPLTGLEHSRYGESASPSSESVPPAKFPIQILHEDDNATIDIVAVHGLAANPDYAWVWQPKNNPPGGRGYPDKHFNWLKDLLPAKLGSSQISSRVMTFNYDSKWLKDAPQQRLSNISDNLLNSLRNDREKDAKNRPLIFIGHSFGGNLIEQALVSASRHRSEYAEIAESTVGVIFLGTPHRGSPAATWGYLLASLAPSQFTCEDRILKDLEERSGTLTDRLHDFSHWLFSESVPVLCCFELFKTDYSSRLGPIAKILSFKELVVPENSACIDGHLKISLDTDHFKINKFYGPDDPSFKKVYPEIERIAKGSGDMLSRRRCPLAIPTNEGDTTGDLRKCLQKMRVKSPEDILSDVRVQKGKRVGGTCKWILKQNEFSAWGAADTSQLFRVIGSPGIGKTTLSTFLVEVLQKKVEKSPQKMFAYFFCDDKINDRRTSTAILRSLIWQLLLQNNDLFQHIQPDFERHEGSRVFEDLFDNFSTLWRIFQHMIKDDRAGEVFILIDALDECDMSTRKGLLIGIKEIFPEPTSCSGKYKFLITCRPEISDIEGELKSVGSSLIIDGRNINADLSHFINFKVNELACRKGYSEVLADKVKNSLSADSGGTFLWVSLMVADLESVLMYDVEEKLKSLPHGLDSAYASILGRINPSVQNVAKFVLHCIVAAKEPLKKIEIMTAFAVSSRTRKIDTVPLREDVQLYNDIFSACSSIFYISNLESGGDATLNFCHQSVKDFLLSGGPHSNEKWYHTTMDEANLVIFQACWRYLSAEQVKLGNMLLGPRMGESGIVLFGNNKWMSEDDVIEDYRTYCFLEYTVDWWIDHTMKSFPAWSHDLTIDMKEAPALRECLLLEAAKGGNQEMVSHLIRMEANPNVRDLNGQTPLHHAICRENVAIVQLLLAAENIDVNIQDKNGKIPLHHAICRENVAIVQLLLAAENIDMNAQDENGYTPLHWAICPENNPIVRLFLTNTQNQKGRKPLHWAVYKKTEAMVRLLVATENIDVNRQDERGRTPLHWAAWKGLEGIVRLLLTTDVDVNLQDQKGLTPLNLAVWRGCEAISELLRAAGAVDSSSENDVDLEGCSEW